MVLVVGCGNSPDTANQGPRAVSAIESPSHRDSGVVALVGDRVFVVGGYDGDEPDARRDGAVFDLSSQRWRSVPSMPVARPLHYPVGVTVGAHLVVLGTQCSAQVRLVEDDRLCTGATNLAALALDSRSAHWRQLELPGGLPRERLLVEVGLGATTHDAMFRVRWPSEDHDDLLLRINPATAVVTTAPLPPEGATTICATEEGITAARYLDQATAIEAPEGGLQELPVALSAWRLVGETWSDPIRFQPPSQAPVAFSALCAGASTVVAPSAVKGTGSAEAFVFDGTAWSAITAPPVDLGYRPQYVWTGAEVVAWSPNAVVGFDPHTRGWRTIERPATQPSHVFWDGNKLILLTSAEGSETTVRPSTLAGERAPEPPLGTRTADGQRSVPPTRW